jgi:hypothetical protein
MSDRGHGGFVHKLRWLIPFLVLGLTVIVFSARARPVDAQTTALCVTFPNGYYDPNQHSLTGGIISTEVFQDCRTGELLLVGFNWGCPKGQTDYVAGKCKVPVLQPDNGCYLLSDPAVSALSAPLRVVQGVNSQQSSSITRQVTGISGFTSLASCQNCPALATAVPPTRAPTATWTPRPASTSTPAPARTPSPTRTPLLPTLTPAPSFTRVPLTATPLPTAVGPNVLELNVTPINQHASPAILLSNGVADKGDYDCFIASMSMALEYLKSQKILGDQETPSYRELVPIVRGTTPPHWSLTNDSAFVSDVTHGKLNARSWYTRPENLAASVESELKANRPVVVSVPNWNLLAAHWRGQVGHSILVYGLHDGQVNYVDPWDGGRYSLTTGEFASAGSFRDGSFLVTFEVVQR